LLHNGLIATASSQLLGELFVEADVELLDAVIIGNSTFMQAPPTHNAAFFGISSAAIATGGNLPLTLLEPSDFTFNSSGVPMNTGDVSTTVIFTPGRYRVNIYANPTLTVHGAGSASITFGAVADTNTIIVDTASINNISAGSQDMTVPINFTGLWHSATAANTNLVISATNTTGGVGVISYGTVGNNYSNNTSGNYTALGGLVIVEAL